MKARCKLQHPVLAGLLDKGDVIDIDIIRHPTDTILAYEGEWKWFGKGDQKHRQYVVDFNKPIIAEAGSFKSWRFKSKNGEWYDESCMRSLIGYIALPEIFDSLQL